MRISIVRSAPFAHHNPKVLDEKAEHLWMDQGIQTFRMVLAPHPDTLNTGHITRVAEEFIAPSVAIYQGIHGGTMPKTGSFLSADAKNVIVTSIKLSESGEDVIVRCVETSGIAVSATLDMKFAGLTWKGNFRPFEIKTLRVDKAKGKVKEVNLLEE